MIEEMIGVESVGKSDITVAKTIDRNVDHTTAPMICGETGPPGTNPLVINTINGRSMGGDSQCS